MMTLLFLIRCTKKNSKGMKIKASLSLIIIFTIISCKDQKDGLQSIDNVPSQICSDVRGITGLYWDLSNGIPRSDIPGGVPTIKNYGGTFSHSVLPLLGFEYPAGYNAIELSNASTQLVGVNVLRNDNIVLWRYYSASFSGQTNADQINNSEVNTFLNGFGFNSNQIQVICSNSTSPQITSVLVTTFSSLLIQVGNMTAQFVATVNYEADLNVSFYNVQVCFAPSSEYETVVMSAFLPIQWQLLYSGEGYLDSDGDGIADKNDNFPFDPKRQ